MLRFQRLPSFRSTSLHTDVGAPPPDAFGPFRVLHQVGVGVHGPVFRAYDPDRDRLVAVKLFRLDEPPDRKLLIVDDDKLYPPDMVERFHLWAEAYPDTAIGSSGWVVPADLTDRPVTAWRTLRGAPPARLKATRVSTPIAVDCWRLPRRFRKKSYLRRKIVMRFISVKTVKRSQTT